MFNINDFNILRLSALLHDIGKFYQRTGHKHSDKIKLSQEDYGRNGAHGKWSLDFINRYYDEIIGNLALYHHNPNKSFNKKLCQMIQKADHHSSSEREKLEDNQKVNQSPLISVASEISLDDNKISERYIPLKKLGLSNEDFDLLSPKEDKNLAIEGWNLEPEYKSLWEEFTREFEKIPNKYDFNTVLSLLKKYTSTMPSAAYLHKSDISLYDHSKTTAALATCRYLFDRDSKEKLKQTNDQNTYLIISGDISGIQKFIFKVSSPQEAQSGMSKRLRGRSLYLSLLCDAIATCIAEELELSQANILFCGGGRFTIIGANTAKSIKKLAEIKLRINNYFIEKFNSELYLALDSLECSGDDLGSFGKLNKNLSNLLNEDKKHKFVNNLNEVFDFNEEILYEDLCAVCGMPFKKNSDSDSICKECNNHEKLGQKASNADYMIKVFTKNKSGFYIEPTNITYFFEKNSKDLVKKINTLANECEKLEVIRLNDTDFLDIASNEFKDNVSFSFSFQGNTVPNLGKYSPTHKYMPLYFEHLAEISKGSNKLGILKMDVDNLGRIFSDGFKKTFDENSGISRISTLSSQLDMFFSGFVNNIASNYKVYTQVDDEEKFEKIDLKVQMDDLDEEEFVYIYKLKYEYLNEDLSNLEKYAIPTIHINYSGGDDLLVLGPYDDIISFAWDLRSKFKQWTGNNSSINLSAGVNIVSPKFPIGKAAIMAEEYLEASKSCGRNKITLFGETVNWNTIDLNKGFDDLYDFACNLEDYCENNRLSKGIVYSMLHLWQNSYNYQGLLSDENSWLEDINNRLSIRRFVPLFKYKLRLVKDKDVYNCLNKNGLKFMPWIKIPVSWVSLRMR